MAQSIDFNDRPNEQQSHIDGVRALLPTIYGCQPLALVRTYGCQQNVADSQRIKGLLALMGYGFTESEHEADLILFNTCAVREHAEDRVLGNVGALVHHKRRRPDCLIALCGCMMQQAHICDQIKESYPHVDLVFGTHVIHRLPEYIYRRLTGSPRIFSIPDSDGVIVEGLPEQRDGGIKGFLSVMYGCNNFCSYCVVPLVRGRERSRRPEDILADAWDMLAAGYKDITLLGQNVNSYGKAEGMETDFAGLLRRLNDLPGDFRLRFMTSHPKDCSPALIAAMRDCGKVMGHIHLPVQAGSNRVLSAMNRGYTREDYLQLVDDLRAAVPDVMLTSDIIVGFPGETHDEFLETLDLVRRVRYSSLFMFIYSPREGTPAAALPNPVSHREKTEWFRELQDAEEPIAAALLRQGIGRVMPVLCDGVGRNEGVLVGRTEGNTIVEFSGTPDTVGQFVKVRIDGVESFRFRGSVV